MKIFYVTVLAGIIGALLVIRKLEVVCDVQACDAKSNCYWLRVPGHQPVSEIERGLDKGYYLSRVFCKK